MEYGNVKYTLRCEDMKGECWKEVAKKYIVVTWKTEEVDHPQNVNDGVKNSKIN